MESSTTSIRTNEISEGSPTWVQVPGRGALNRLTGTPPQQSLEQSRKQAKLGWRVLSHSAAISAVPTAGLERAEVESALLFGFGLLLLLLATLLRQWTTKEQGH